MQFTKYQATGNDFILMDNLSGKIKFSAAEIQKLCDRKFGIGADGLILIEKSTEADFYVNYYNSDGSQSLCGNGSRAAVHFAATLGLVKEKTIFDAYDGLHEATILNNDIVDLQMRDVEHITKRENGWFINTGSPHVIEWVNSAEEVDVFTKGKNIRYAHEFAPSGTNVNFVEKQHNNTLFVRTYERGVENETLSCGTGVTAAGIAAALEGYSSPVQIETRGGNLSVSFEKETNETHQTIFSNVHLIGPAKIVFSGSI
ncbi:MAG: diaminopimelate epimerase [Cyclobacteriaceae bacterium]|jgi:diaminopimelate epimerase|nr:diaminopimelate epimerase [Cyclobacteriaceae bacterium]